MVFCSLLAFSAQDSRAQTREELNSLIFEPVLLDSAPAFLPQNNGSPADSNVTGDTQEADVASMRQAITRYQESIGVLKQTESIYSESLREQSQALAQLQQQSGDHESAIAELEAAMHIDRVNHGLFTIRQIDLVNQLLVSHDALGHTEEVADLQEYLYYIQRKSFPAGDPRLLAAIENWADWNVKNFFKSGSAAQLNSADGFSSSNSPSYVVMQNTTNGTVDFIPRERLQNVLGARGPANSAISQNSMPAESMVDDRLKKAETLYEELLEESSLTQDPQRRLLLQQKMASVAYATKEFFDDLIQSMQTGPASEFRLLSSKPNIPLVTRGYGKNRDALEALIAGFESDPETPASVTSAAWLGLGDWYLGYNRTRQARDAYRKAWELVQPTTSTQPLTLNNPLLNPGVIQPVPAYTLHPYSRELVGIDPDEELDYKGYIDIVLTLDELGKIRKEKIIATSADTPQLIRSALLDYLRNNRMRPIIQNGETVTIENLDLRFYYYY